MVELREVSYRVGSAVLLDDVTVGFRQARFNAVLGPNGAGKSTLLRVAAGLMPPSAGEVLYDSRSIAGIPPASLARTRAVLSQHVELAFPLTVAEVVLIGRYAHYDTSPARRDVEIVDEALDLVGMSVMRDREYWTLSGGEQQKVQLARVLAQIWSRDPNGAPTVLFLDEPTTGLDLRYQIQLLELARKLLEYGCTIVAVLHDLNVALEYGDTFVLMRDGRIVLDTDSCDDVTELVIESVFGVRARRVPDPVAGDAVWRFGV